MPVESKAQSRFLNWKFGHEWVKKHHFAGSLKDLPLHKHKMNDPSKLIRLSEIDSNLESIINFAYGNEDPQKRSLTGTAVKAGALVGTGTAGTLAHQAVQRSGGYAANWAAGKQAYKYGADALARATGNVGTFGSRLGGMAGGLGAQFRLGLQKLKTILPAMKGLSSGKEEIQFDEDEEGKENILEPFSDGAVPDSKIIEEQFPAGLSPAAVLQFPFPKLMAYLNQRNILQQQYSGFSKIGRLMELNSKLDEITFADKEKRYKARPVQRFILGPGLTSAIHTQRGYRPEAYGEARSRNTAEEFKGSLKGGIGGAAIGTGLGALSHSTGAGALIGTSIGSGLGALYGKIKGTYGSRATSIYRRRTGQEHA